MAWRSRLETTKRFLDRFPWLLPAFSFAAGWLGFILVQRGEALASVVALMALAGWPWLLMEPFVRRRIERGQPGLGKIVVNFISQSLQQELLFFSLPFLFGATQPDLGHWVFAALAVAAAAISTVDPFYERWVAARAANRLLFHGYCSWMAALVVLPMVLRLPVERTLPLSLVIVTGSILVTLPLALMSLRTWTQRAAWLAAIAILPLAAWQLRSHIPAAGLIVTEARMTQSIDELTPGAPVTRLPRAALGEGLIAFAAIRAPTGLLQTVIFQWRHGGEVENIVEQIHGGRSQGWRTYSRKRIFPVEPDGQWTVDVLTPQGQLLKRLRFAVE